MTSLLKYLLIQQENGHFKFFFRMFTEDSFMTNKIANNEHSVESGYFYSSG